MMLKVERWVVQLALFKLFCMMYTAYTGSRSHELCRFYPEHLWSPKYVFCDFLRSAMANVANVSLYADKLQSSSNAISCITGSQFEQVADLLLSEYCGRNKVELNAVAIIACIMYRCIAGKGSLQI